MTKRVMGEVYSPYQKETSETMEEWYAEYLEDEDKYISLGDCILSKIIYRCEFYGREGCCFLVAFETQELIREGDVLMDEEGHEFSVMAFANFRFGKGVPEWSFKVASVVIRGISYDIGNYLCKKYECFREEGYEKV